VRVQLNNNWLVLRAGNGKQRVSAVDKLTLPLHSGGDGFHTRLQGQSPRLAVTLPILISATGSAHSSDLYPSGQEHATSNSFMRAVSTRPANVRYKPALSFRAGNITVRGACEYAGFGAVVSSRDAFKHVHRCRPARGYFGRYNGINFRRQDLGFGFPQRILQRATLDRALIAGTRNRLPRRPMSVDTGNGHDSRPHSHFRPTRRVRLDEIYLTSLRTPAYHRQAFS
jgi:hypothetical protein